jgi:hypothetical protein
MIQLKLDGHRYQPDHGQGSRHSAVLHSTFRGGLLLRSVPLAVPLSHPTPWLQGQQIGMIGTLASYSGQGCHAVALRRAFFGLPGSVDLLEAREWLSGLLARQPGTWGLVRGSRPCEACKLQNFVPQLFSPHRRPDL